MSQAAPSPALQSPSRRQRLLRHWWRSQPAHHQDRVATLAPLLSVLLFLAAMVLAFWYLRNEEIDRASETVKHDTELAQQQIRLRLIDNQEQLARLAGELAARPVTEQHFIELAAALLRDRPELDQLAWLSPRGDLLAAYSRQDLPSATPPPGSAASAPAGAVAALVDPAARLAMQTARERRQSTYSRMFRNAQRDAVFQFDMPLYDRATYRGMLVVDYAVEPLLRQQVPVEVTQRHTVSIVDVDAGQTIGGPIAQAGAGNPSQHAPHTHQLPLVPANNGLLIRTQGWRSSVGLIGNALFWMVVALSALTVWTLLGTWRHVRRRSQIQAELVHETNFRRAMENSMLTGMRAMDLEGRITYVNPAYCAMTGFSEADLIGRSPPFPHWPPDRIDENMRLLQQELHGRSPVGGIEVRVMRKDGSLFDARMYVSALVDPTGRQEGWMTSMTNITDAKRIRDQLTASHERFTTVLEGLDAAVSVLSVQHGELLFANRSYRLWFGAEAAGHAALAGPSLAQPYLDDHADLVDGLSGLPTEEVGELGSQPSEVYIDHLQKWFDVRSRYLQWTDGRLAQMLIATDITARRAAEEAAAHQAEKAQVTSRLVTMGEMASSVAHELNQPLTAIVNYCNGMVSRVQADQIAKDDLIAALEKTSRQAQRAGQIIHRIRSFVKRSEPQRQTANVKAIVDEAVDLANIEMRRRNVQLHVYVAQRLPPVRCDPILIEQVLLNLMKNAAEAIDNAQLPPARRHIELRVVPRHTAEDGAMMEFSVIDMGPGACEEVLARMYEAFFSTKSDGLGIGLSLCRSIIESHRGRIRTQNLYNGEAIVGFRFVFTLPLDQGLVELGTDREASAAPSTHSAATP